MFTACSAGGEADVWDHRRILPCEHPADPLEQARQQGSPTAGDALRGGDDGNHPFTHQAQIILKLCGWRWVGR